MRLIYTLSNIITIWCMRVSDTDRKYSLLHIAHKLEDIRALQLHFSHYYSISFHFTYINFLFLLILSTSSEIPTR